MALRFFILFAILMSLWLLMSGHYTPLITGLGAVSVGFATFMSWRLGGTDDEGLPLQMMRGAMPLYFIWLVKEIITSNITTAKIILKNTPAPEFFTIKIKAKTPAGIALYANSITLTPGTVTVAIDDSNFRIHALDGAFADDIRSGAMDRRVAEMEPKS